MNIRKNYGLSGAKLKWLALITMLIDHIGAFIIYPCGPLYPHNQMLETLYVISRDIGRLSFPLFAFLLVEGFFGTKNIKRYLFNLGVFALISEIPHDLAEFGVPFEVSLQNIFFTLFVGLAAITVFDYFKEKKYLKWIIPIAAMSLATITNVDYGYNGIALIFIFYCCREHLLIKNTLAGLLLLRQPTAIFALIPINLYNGERGRQHKFFFYWFYPVHLLLLYLLTLLF